MNIKFLLLLVLANCFCLGVSGQRVAIKTNTLYWVTGTFNVGVEVAVSGHSTVGMSGNYNPWTFGEDGKVQHWLVQPEYRYWFSEKFNRGFLGVNLVAGQYTVGGFKLPFNMFPSVHTHHYEGWAVGFGVSYGYNWYLGSHWNLEAVIGVGYARTRYSRSDTPKIYTSRDYVGPTQLGITFVYLFNSRKL